MIKKILIILCMFTLTVNAQKGKTKTKTKPVATVDSTGMIVEPEIPTDPFEALELTLPAEVELDPMTGKKLVHKEVKRKNDSLRADLRKRIKKERMTFAVRTKHPDKKINKPQRMQLCFNLVGKDTNLLHCINDSILIDPEVVKMMFEKTVGDSTYMLIYVDAFTKSNNELCNAGHETKLYFFRWNQKTNGIKMKYKNIASCTKGITNMTKAKVVDWDKTSPLDIRYNRSFYFYEIRFDPANYLLGIQTLKDEAKDAKKEEH